MSQAKFTDQNIPSDSHQVCIGQTLFGRDALLERARICGFHQRIPRKIDACSLLEAIAEYNNCRSELLTAADNYGLIHFKITQFKPCLHTLSYLLICFIGLLNLDVAWCYLQLGNLSQLPQAEERLSECQLRLNQSYGNNFERIEAIKGSAVHEKAVYARMHLLQGIVAFHQGNLI